MSTSSAWRVTLAAWIVASCSKPAGSASATHQGGDSTVASGVPLPSSSGGRWQFVSLPDSWIERYWIGAPPAGAYLALRGPDPSDLGKYTPCDAPPRLLVGLVDQNDSVEERLLVCLRFCAPTDGVRGVYRDLWGARTHLDGITAQILEDGSIDVLEHFRLLAETPYAVARDLAVVDKLRYQAEVRVRHHRFTARDLMAAKGGNPSCLTQPYDPPY